MKSALQRILAVALPIGLGAFAVNYMLSTIKEPPRKQAVEQAVPMRVIETRPLELVPRATGFGLANSDTTWRAVARVPGRLVEIHQGMRSGAAVNAGDLLVQIDTIDTEIAIASAEAEIARLQSDLDQLVVEEANNAAALEIEQAALVVASSELARFEDLLAKDASAAAEVEDRRRSELTQRQTVQSIESSQALVPGRRSSIEAQLAGARATLAQAQRDRGHCEITAPFDGILGEVTLEVDQYVAGGELLFELYDDSRVRIDAALPQDEVLRMVDENVRQKILLAIANPSARQELLGGLFEATASTRIGGLEHSWPGQVVGARESLDAETRALRLTVVIEQKREELFERGSPPLNRGTYCQVDVRAQPRSGALVVPRSALQDDSVLIVDADNRLARLPLDIEFTQGELAVVRAGLEVGTRVVISPPAPAVLGILVEPVPDPDLAERLRQDASSGAGE